jgi:hypothetical protein
MDNVDASRVSRYTRLCYDSTFLLLSVVQQPQSSSLHVLQVLDSRFSSSQARPLPPLLEDTSQRLLHYFRPRPSGRRTPTSLRRKSSRSGFVSINVSLSLVGDDDLISPRVSTFRKRGMRVSLSIAKCEMTPEYHVLRDSRHLPPDALLVDDDGPFGELNARGVLTLLSNALLRTRQTIGADIRYHLLPK